jgi:hypothetical protein
MHEGLTAERRYYEQEIEAVEAKWRSLDGKRLYAWLCIGAGALLLIRYLAEKDWANHEALGSLALIMLVIGGIWLHDLRSRLDALSRRSTALRETLDSVSVPRLGAGEDPPRRLGLGRRCQF